MQMFDEKLARMENKRVVTRGGHVVSEWHKRRGKHAELIPIVATIVAHGVPEEMTFTANGRRYVNVESEFDLMIEEVKNREKPDCMPDVLSAIRCVREGRYSDIKHHNKNYLRNDTTRGVAVDTSALKNY